MPREITFALYSTEQLCLYREKDKHIQSSLLVVRFFFVVKTHKLVLLKKPRPFRVQFNMRKPVSLESPRAARYITPTATCVLL